MEVKYKLIVIGDTGVGKTSLLKRKRDNIFETQYTSTLGVDFYFLNIKDEDKNIKIYIWDTAGQEKYNNLINVYFRDIDSAMILYDITDKKSFNNIQKWISKIKMYNTNNIPFILVGTKSDLEKNRQVLDDDIDSFVKKNNYLHSICSSKNNINIDKTFDTIINEMYKFKPPLFKKTEYVEFKNEKQKKNCCSIL